MNVALCPNGKEEQLDKLATDSPGQGSSPVDEFMDRCAKSYNMEAGKYFEVNARLTQGKSCASSSDGEKTDG